MRMFPSDVPVHRPSVGAMALASTAQRPEYESRFKPYVYRGWGYDVFDPENAGYVMRPQAFTSPEEVDVVAQWLAEERKRKVTPPQPKPKPRKKRRKKSKPRPAKTYYPPLRLVPPLPPEPEFPETPAPVPDKPRPAPGWKPLTGADIDDILNEIEDS